MLEDKQILKYILPGETLLNPTWVLLEERKYLGISCMFLSSLAVHEDHPLFAKPDSAAQSCKISQHNPANLVMREVLG